MPGHRRGLWLGTVILGIIGPNSLRAVTPSPAPALPAEYAIRWNIKDGGPATATAVLASLKRAQDDSGAYEVRYFDFRPPADGPPGFAPTLRQRVKGKKHELTFKYRGDHPLSAWRCPLSSTPDEAKGEVDVSIPASGDPKRAYSYSCTLESKGQPVAPPDALKAQPTRCVSTMTRLKAGDLKVEEWHMPEGVIVIEVSRNGADTPHDLSDFQATVVAPLLEAGIKPTDRSKTELGRTCE